MSAPRFVQQKVPFPMQPCLSESKREEFMKWAVDQGFPRMTDAFAPIGDGILTIVGFGPSLADTWQYIKPPLITTSGALKFLLERGMKPKLGEWFHAEVDPRPHKLELLKPPHWDVTYLIGSVCNPKVWKLLRGYRTLMWHAISGPHSLQWVRENDPGTVLVGAGSTIGLSAIHLGGCLGYRKFEIHGMDGSFREGNRHAAFHGGIPHGQIPSEVSPGYMTSKIMENTNVEVQNMLRNFPIFCVFHGDGAIQDWVRREGPLNSANAGTQKAEAVRRTTFRRVTEVEARELQAQGMEYV